MVRRDSLLRVGPGSDKRSSSALATAAKSPLA
jgi:hypothetical protein